MAKGAIHLSMALTVLAGGLLGCQNGTPDIVATEPPAVSTMPSVDPSETNAPLTSEPTLPPGIPSDTPSPATATDNPGTGLIRLRDFGFNHASPPSLLYIDPADATGLVKPGVDEGVPLNDWWLVQVQGQSSDGIFVFVKILEADHTLDYQQYIGLTGWMYSYWVGEPEPILPAQYPVVREPESLIPYRQDFYNYYVGEIYSTMVAQGTKPADDLAYEALVATQTEWAALQTPQP